MKVAIIPPTSKTGESTVNMHLIHGLLGRGVDVKILQHFVLNTTNRKIFLGSLLLKRLLNDDSVSLVHNVDNLGPFLFRHKDWQIKKSAHCSRYCTSRSAASIWANRARSNLAILFYTVLPKLIDNCDLIIVDSFSTMTDLTAKFRVSKEKIAVVHLGSIHLFFALATIAATFWINMACEISSYSMLAPIVQKNLKTLIRAYVSIFQEISHDLVLIGRLARTRYELTSSRAAPRLTSKRKRRKG